MRIRGALVIAALVLVACEAEQMAAPHPEPSPSQTAIAAPAVIYSAVIRQLVTKDHTFGRASSPFKHIYVVDGPIAGAGKPTADMMRRPPRPFPDGLHGQIETQLRDLPPVDFIRKASAVQTGEDGLGGVRNKGVIVILGRIKEMGEKIHVSANLWCSGLCGRGLTYVLEERAGAWQITGTTGSMWIS